MKKAQLEPLSKSEVLDLVNNILASQKNSKDSKIIKEAFRKLGAKDPIDESSRMTFLLEQLRHLEQK